MISHLQKNKVGVLMSATVEQSNTVPISLNIRIEQAFQAYHGRIIKVLDPLNKENACYEIAKRILLIVSAVIIYPIWGFKCLIDRCINIQKSANQPQTRPTLTSEIEYAKRKILDRAGLDNSDFNDAKSAKLFLVIRHGGNVFHKNVILPQDVNKEQILTHFDTLVNDIQQDIIFNSTSKTKVNIGILAKGKKDYQGQPIFSYTLTAHATVHYGELSNPGIASATKVLASNAVQNSFCDLMEINQAPQIDYQGNFI